MEALSGVVEDVSWYRVEDSNAPGAVRRAAVALAARLGYSEHRTGEVAIVATELATNLDRHAIEGTIALRVRRDVDVAGIELLATDAGPGIADLSVFALDGNSSAGTLGIGLGAAIRLATWFDAYSLLGRGTVMIATFWPEERTHIGANVASLTRAMVDTAACGDATAYREGALMTTVLLADGLGHGELAAVASRAAIRAFTIDEDPHRDPAQTLRRLHSVLQRTRGAAVGVLRLDWAKAAITFAGVGNIEGWIDDGDRRRPLSSTPGIVGSNMRTIREVTHPMPASGLVILHTDGLTGKWNLDDYPGLRTRDPNLVAATLMRDAGIRNDDRGIVVVKLR
jgi:anti-sigma regulatory factor (Ser/Thr protein kinase)